MFVHHSESRPGLANYEVHPLVGFYSSFFVITQALCFARGMPLSFIIVAQTLGSLSSKNKQRYASVAWLQGTALTSNPSNSTVGWKPLILTKRLVPGQQYYSTGHPLTPFILQVPYSFSGLTKYQKRKR